MKVGSFAIGLFLIGLMFIPLQESNAQSVTDRVEFSVRTSTPGGNYSPRNIGAVWIEDSSGHFVKTLKLWANRRIQYLYTWNSISGRNTIDAVTGPTVTSHQTHNATWNVTDVNGDPVPEGNYTLNIEMTDRHAQGPLASFEFPVGQVTDSLVIPDETYFHDLELRWFSTTVGIGYGDLKNPAQFQLYQNYPNPFNPVTTVKFALFNSGFVNLKIYDLQGEEIATLISDYLPMGDYKYDWNATGLASGVYVVRIDAGGLFQTRKIVLLK